VGENYITIIQQIAQRHGQTEQQVRRDMQQALDAAWTSADPNAKKLRAELFLNGKPSPEEFVLTLTRYIENPSH